MGTGAPLAAAAGAEVVADLSQPGNSREIGVVVAARAEGYGYGVDSEEEKGERVREDERLHAVGIADNDGGCLTCGL